MRSIILLVLLASWPFQVGAQTPAKHEIYALDTLSDHTARVGTSNVFVYQTRGGSLATFLLGGAFLNSRAMTRQSESLANSINSASTVQEFGAIGRIIEEKSATNLIKQHAILLSVDSDEITRATLIVHVQDKSDRGINYFYHFKPTLPNSELQSDRGMAFFTAIQEEAPTALDALVAVLGSPQNSGNPTKAQSDFMRIYGKIKIPFKGQRYPDIGDLSVVNIDGKPGAIRFGLIDGVHLFHTSQVEYK